MRKLCPDVAHDFAGFTKEPIKGIFKETVNVDTVIKEGRKKGWEGGRNKCEGERFRDRDLGEIHELRDTTAEE